MSIHGTEALAGLQLLVAVARADSAITTNERSVIVGALEDANLPRGITTERLLESTGDVDALIAQIQSQSARDVARDACLTMANATRVCPPNQQAILDKIEKGWAVRPENEELLAGVVADAACDLVRLTPLGRDDAARPVSRAVGFRPMAVVPGDA
jgi:hypothetical protein